MTEALALFTVTPAILNWASQRHEWAKKSREYALEAAALVVGVLVSGYIAFVAGFSSPPVLYSLLPFLLWSALRFGSTGISTAMLAMAFLSTWGAVHGRGPFTGPDPLNNVSSLQLFLLFAGVPFMILAALVEDRKQAAQAVSESEKRFRLVADTAPALIWMSGVDKLCTYFNQSWLNFTGRSVDSEIGNGWADGIHPEERQNCLDTYNESFDRRQNLKMEYRLRRYDGEYRWILDIGVPRFSAESSFAGYIGIAIDVTDRKAAEAALKTVSRRLIEAQEQERTRIARELHDDTGQRLALLANELGQLEQHLPAEVGRQVTELRRQTFEIATGIQTLSHELYSSKLEYLGLMAAMRSFCKEFSEQRRVEIDFKSDDLPRHLPRGYFALPLPSAAGIAAQLGQTQWRPAVRGTRVGCVRRYSSDGEGFRLGIRQGCSSGRSRIGAHQHGGATETRERELFDRLATQTRYDDSRLRPGRGRK